MRKIALLLILSTSSLFPMDKKTYRRLKAIFKKLEYCKSVNRSLKHAAKNSRHPLPYPKSLHTHTETKSGNIQCKPADKFKVMCEKALQELLDFDSLDNVPLDAQ